MGAADVVPGVSGGTMAFILGIYEELLNAIKSFDFKSLRLLAAFRMEAFFEKISWQFLLSLGLGILTAIFTFSKFLAWLLENEPVLIWSFFLGLILASVVTVSKRVDQWKVSRWVSLLCGLVGIYILVGLVPVSTPDDLWFLFVSGAVAICAMILPGISGSFILVLMGKYQAVLQAVNEKELPPSCCCSGWGMCGNCPVFSPSGLAFGQIPRSHGGPAHGAYDWFTEKGVAMEGNAGEPG